MSTIKFNVSSIQRIFLFICVTILCLIVGSLLMTLIINGELSSVRIRIATVIQDIVLFVIPAVVTAMMICRQPAAFLGIDSSVSLKWFVLAALILISSIPFMNFVIHWNESLSLPSSFQWLELLMKEGEANAKTMIATLFGGKSWGSLIVALLIVAVLAAFSEELFFRGTLQRILVSSNINIHISIWATAFIFSAIHLQFFGFFPRMLLGALFGYMMWWSGSLWPAIFAHMANNLCAATTTWMEIDESYSSPLTSIGTNSESYSDIATVFASVAITIILIIICVKNRVKQ